MSAQVTPLPRPLAKELVALREQVADARAKRGPTFAFGVAEVDAHLADRGLDLGGLHEFGAASATLNDDAAATLFIAGIAAQLADQDGVTIFWTATAFDLYAPGLEQVGLAPDKLLYGQGRKDIEVLAMAEDALRDGSLACVIAEVKAADMTATRRLQLAASDGKTPMLLYRRHRTRDRCPLTSPSSAMTRWRVGCLPSERTPWAGVGRARWLVELVRQRNGNPFSLELEACDAKGRLALPAATGDRTPAQERASRHAA